MGYALSQLTDQHFPRLLDGITEPSQWESKRRRIQATWQQYLGWMPGTFIPDFHIHAEYREANHIRLHLTYATGYGDQVPAYLLIPGPDAKPQGTLFPAMLALHPTDAKGKADIATRDGRANRQYALELVARGYVVLAPDTITAGERIYPHAEAFQTAPFYALHPNATAIGKMLHDHQQGLNLLQSLPFVDAKRIGAIGHSLGGYNAYFLATIDRRIRAVVSSCGFCPFLGDTEPNRWGQRDWFSHMPRLTPNINNDFIPFEFHEIMSLAAPTPIFNWFAQNDHIFPNWQAAAIESQNIGELYQWLGHVERYEALIGNTGHDFPASIRSLSYQFLDRWLMEEDSI